MDTEEILRKYRETTDKNLIITDADGKMIYESKKMDFPTDVVIGKIKTAPDDFEEQEFWVH